MKVKVKAAWPLVAIAATSLVLLTTGCSGPSDSAVDVGGSDSTATAPSPVETTDQTYEEWANDNTETYSNALVRAADASTRVSSAAGEYNFSALAVALLDLADAGDELESILPSPDSQVNDTVRTLAGTMQSARGLAASATEPDDADLDAILSIGDEISRDLDAVRTALGNAG